VGASRSFRGLLARGGATGTCPRTESFAYLAQELETEEW